MSCIKKNNGSQSFQLDNPPSPHPHATFVANSSGSQSWAQLNFLVTVPITSFGDLTPTQHSKLHNWMSHDGSCILIMWGATTPHPTPTPNPSQDNAGFRRSAWFDVNAA